MSLLRRFRHLLASPSQEAGTHSTPTDASASIVSEVSALAAERRYADAYHVVNSALETAPTNTALLFAKGSVLLDWGRYRESREAYEAAERNGLRSIRLYRHLGWACFHGGDLETAERHLRQAVGIGPDDFDANFCLGVVLQARDAGKEASEAFGEAVAIRANDFQARLMLGNCLLDEGDAAAAEACYANATRIDSTHPAAWVNLGSSLRQQGKLAEAIAAFERALECEKDSDESDVDAFLSVALGYADAGRLGDARDLLERSLERRPSPRAHSNYGILLLQQGWLQEGWRQFGFRWMLDQKGFERPAYGKPVWNGQDIDGKTVLIRAEQGIGDTIQFLRYASLLKDRGARVLLKAPAGLEELAKHAAGLDGMLPLHETPLDFDFYVHTLSIAGAFGTTLDTIPAPIPYIRADPARRARWRGRLGESGRLKAGLVWAGSPEHKRDRFRSIPLALLAPLLSLEGIRFVSLQKGPALAQLNGFALGERLLNLGPELDDLADTAAVIEELDLVIGVDTAVIHLAGAMGKRVWTLIPTPCDWRWLTDGDQTPWYPSMRLFRQEVSGDWGGVVETVARALAERAGSAHEDILATDTAPPREAFTPTSEPPPSDRFSSVAETRYGIVQYFPQPPAIALSLRLYGEYLEPQIGVLRRLLRKDDTAVEVAAGCGAHALALATICSNVIAHDPDPIMRRVLRQNVHANKLPNVAVLPAVSARNDGDPTDATSTLALDALGLSQLGLVKVNDDSLGDVIRGADRTLWHLRPMIFAVASESNGIAMRETLPAFGYRRWSLETPLFNPANFNRRLENVFGSRTQAAILAIPEEREVVVPAECHEIA